MGLSRASSQRGTIQVLPGWWEGEELYLRVLQPVGLLPEQLQEPRRLTGESLLLRELFHSAFDDLRMGTGRQKRDAVEWLLTDCGEISSRMCLYSLGCEDILGFRGHLKKFLSNDHFSLDKQEMKH